MLQAGADLAELFGQDGVGGLEDDQGQACAGRLGVVGLVGDLIDILAAR